MRISTRAINDRLLQHVQLSTTRLNETQERVASGRRINRPSDDPFSTARALNTRSRVDVVTQRIRTTDLATNELAFVESRLVSLGEIVAKADELGVQADSGALDGEARSLIAIQVDELITQTLAIANTTYAGRSIFGGHQLGPAFSPDVPANPTAFTYAGDAGEVLREVGDGETVAVNLPGEALFDGIFASLIAFRDGLRADDRTAYTAAAGDIAREIDGVLAARGEVGARMQRLETTAVRLGEEELHLRTTIAQLEEVDITEELVELQMRDTAFQAALSVTARSLGTSLLDFLR